MSALTPNPSPCAPDLTVRQEREQEEIGLLLLLCCGEARHKLVSFPAPLSRRSRREPKAPDNRERGWG